MDMLKIKFVPNGTEPSINIKISNAYSNGKEGYTFVLGFNGNCGCTNFTIHSTNSKDIKLNARLIL